jgi:hypothetical protein
MRRELRDRAARQYHQHHGVQRRHDRQSKPDFLIAHVDQLPLELDPIPQRLILLPSVDEPDIFPLAFPLALELLPQLPQALVGWRPLGRARSEVVGVLVGIDRGLHGQHREGNADAIPAASTTHS